MKVYTSTERCFKYILKNPDATSEQAREAFLALNWDMGKGALFRVRKSSHEFIDILGTSAGGLLLFWADGTMCWYCKEVLDKEELATIIEAYLEGALEAIEPLDWVEQDTLTEEYIDMGLDQEYPDEETVLRAARQVKMGCAMMVAMAVLVVAILLIFF